MGITIRLTTTLLVCLLLCADAASAAGVRIGATSLNLTPPSGYCELDAAKSTDARAVTFIYSSLGGAGKHLLSMSAECNQLKDWRAGKRPLLDKMAEYQTIMRFEDEGLIDEPKVAIKDACDQLRAQADQVLADMPPGIEARAELVMRTANLNEEKLLGVAGEDPLVCYAALLRKFTDEFDVEKAQASVGAITVLKGKIIYNYLFAPYVSGKTIAHLLAQQRASVAKLQAANCN